MTFWERLQDIFYRTPKIYMSARWLDEYIRNQR
jgi:hypothetical protein